MPKKGRQKYDNNKIILIKLKANFYTKTFNQQLDIHISHDRNIVGFGDQNP